jgi:hypothetical protein
VDVVVEVYNFDLQHVPDTLSLPLKYTKKEISLWAALEAHKVVRRRGFHVFLDSRFLDGGEVFSLTRMSIA